MKIKHQLYILLPLLITIVSISSCKKDKCKAGTGGNLTMKVNIMHHHDYIYGATVRVKFDTQDFPGANGAYDITRVAGPGDSTLTFTGMQCGDYYFSATGTDSTITSTDKTVKGGTPYSTTKEDGIVEFILPVTE